MYAVIKTGGKQYRVAADDIIDIEKLEGSAGDTVTFDQVMMIGGEGTPTIGAPLVEGATVTGEVVDQRRTRKLIIFKKKRRQNYRRRNGHRQDLTRVKITSIVAAGAKPKPAKKAAVKKAPAEEAEAE